MKVKLLIAMFLLLGIVMNIKGQEVKLDGVVYSINSYPDSEGSIVYEARLLEIEDKTTTQIVIASSVEYEGQTYPVTHIATTSVFTSCKNLVSVEVSAGSTSFCSENGVLFNKDKTELYVYPAAKQNDSYFIPEGVTLIQKYAFYGCTKLTSLRIPASIKWIGVAGQVGNFSNCSALTSIEVDPENPSYSSIDGVLFNKNGKILYVYPGGKQGNYMIPEGTLEIEGNAFECAGLTSVHFPLSLESLGSYVFYRCTALTDIYCRSEKPISTSDAPFSEEAYKNATLHIPLGCKSVYEAEKSWRFAHIVEEDPMVIGTNELLDDITYMDGILYLPENVPSNVFIYASNGNLIQTHIATAGNFDLSALSKGAYIIKVEIGKRMVSLKIIK